MEEWTPWHERHAEKIELIPGVDCWIWIAAHGGGGYGRVSYHKAAEFAHRAAFKEFHGHFPKVGRHMCGNKLCVRPSHIKDGSLADNNKDSALAFMTHGFLIESQVLEIRQAYRDGEPLASIAARFGMAYGSIYPIVIGQSYRHIGDPDNRDRALRSPRKLTPEHVAEIKKLLKKGKTSQSAIAEKFGVRQSTISNIATGHRHIKR